MNSVTNKNRATSVTSNNTRSKPEPKFYTSGEGNFDEASRNRIKIPKDLHDSCWAKVVGCEWGPDNQQLSQAYSHFVRGIINGKGWVYFIQFAGTGRTWRASEDEVEEWQAK